MTQIALTIITENQNKIEKAYILGRKIKEELGLTIDPEIEVYIKFDNSFKLSFNIFSNSASHSLVDMAYVANLLCSTWTLLNVDDDIYELIFNKTTESKFFKLDYNVIKWAHLQIQDSHNLYQKIH